MKSVEKSWLLSWMSRMTWGRQVLPGAGVSGGAAVVVFIDEQIHALSRDMGTRSDVQGDAMPPWSRTHRPRVCRAPYVARYLKE